MNFLDVEEISTPSRSLWQKWAAYFFITYTSKNKIMMSAHQGYFYPHIYYTTCKQKIQLFFIFLFDIFIF